VERVIPSPREERGTPMSLTHRVAICGRCLGALSARMPATAFALICAAQLAGPLWGQGWMINGNIISAPADARVGIGTPAPTEGFSVFSSAGTAQMIATQWGSTFAGQSLGFGGDTNVGPYLVSHTGSNGNATGNYSSVRQLFGASGFIIQTSPATAVGTARIFTSQFIVNPSGNVGIGTTAPQSKLAVNGTITTKEVIVTNMGWSDYVFQPNYRLQPLSEIAAYVKEHHHLPEIPTEAEVQAKGVSLGEMQAKLLAKVEELTLHMIQAEERNNRLEQHNRELQERIARLESRGVR
jgi:hypothetical protein